MDYGNIILELYSGDANVVASGGTSVNFTTQLAQDFLLEEKYNYVAAIRAINLWHTGNAKSILVMSDIVDFSNVGSSSYQVLKRIQPVAEPMPYSMEYSSTDAIWRPVRISQLSSVRIWLTSDGTNLISQAPDDQIAYRFCTLTLEIKRLEKI